MALLELRGVSASYGGNAVLRDIDLSLSLGERIAVVGGNGSGKSTLLKVIGGLVKPERGSLNYLGKAQPAFLFQNPRQQLICDSVQQEIRYSLQLQGQPNAELDVRVADLLRDFSLEEIASLPPDALSGGQQQRVALAALLTREPELVLLDEPESFLDGRLRVEFRNFFERAFHNCGVIWTCCRNSEIPDGFTAFTLFDGKLTRLNFPNPSASFSS